VRAWLTSAVLLWALQSVAAGLWAALHLGLAVRSRRGGAGWATTVLLPLVGRVAGRGAGPGGGVVGARGHIPRGVVVGPGVGVKVTPSAGAW
jgi:hypothetical protein